MYDPSSQQWSSQQTSGTAPVPITDPCTVVAQSDNNTYEARINASVPLAYAAYTTIPRFSCTAAKVEPGRTQWPMTRSLCSLCPPSTGSNQRTQMLSGGDVTAATLLAIGRWWQWVVKWAGIITFLQIHGTRVWVYSICPLWNGRTATIRTLRPILALSKSFPISRHGLVGRPSTATAQATQS